MRYIELSDFFHDSLVDDADDIFKQFYCGFPGIDEEYDLSEGSAFNIDGYIEVLRNHFDTVLFNNVSNVREAILESKHNDISLFCFALANKTRSTEQLNALVSLLLRYIDEDQSEDGRRNSMAQIATGSEFSLLMLAASFGCGELIDYLWKLDAPTEKQMRLCMFYACYYGQSSIVKLIDQYADGKYRWAEWYDGNRSVLHLTVLGRSRSQLDEPISENRKELLSFLLRDHPKVEGSENDYHHHLPKMLHALVQVDDFGLQDEAAIWLLTSEYGVDINIEADGSTALSLAVNQGVIKAVECLVKYGAIVTKDLLTSAQELEFHDIARLLSERIQQLNSWVSVILSEEFSEFFKSYLDGQSRRNILCGELISDKVGPLIHEAFSVEYDVISSSINFYATSIRSIDAENELPNSSLSTFLRDNADGSGRCRALEDMKENIKKIIDKKRRGTDTTDRMTTLREAVLSFVDEAFESNLVSEVELLQSRQMSEPPDEHIVAGSDMDVINYAGLSESQVDFCDRFEVTFDQFLSVYIALLTGRVVTVSSSSDDVTDSIVSASEALPNIPIPIGVGPMTLSLPTQKVVQAAVKLWKIMREHQREASLRRVSRMFGHLRPFERVTLIRSSGIILAKRFENQLGVIANGQNGVETFADFCVERIMHYIERSDGNIEHSRPSRVMSSTLHFLSGLGLRTRPQVEREFEPLDVVMINAIGENLYRWSPDEEEEVTLMLRHGLPGSPLGRNWTAKGVFEQTGIIDEENKFYCSIEDGARKYGFVFAERAEASNRNMTILPEDSDLITLWYEASGAGETKESAEDSERNQPRGLFSFFSRRTGRNTSSMAVRADI